MVLNGLVAARVAALAADRLHPLPAWQEFQAGIAADRREGIDGHNPSGERAAELERRLLAEYGVESIAELPIDFSGVALQEDEEYGALVYDKHYGALREIQGRQDRIHRLGGFLAPSLAIRDLSMGLSGTDMAHHVHFASAAETYRRDLVRVMNEAVINTAPDAYEAKLGDRALWESVPDFVWSPPSARWALERQAGRMGALGFWLVLSGVLAVGTTRRFRLDS